MPLVLVSTQLSDRLSETPEGYLLCEGVSLARTGALEYLAEEAPDVAPGSDDTVQVYRLAEDLFDARAMASFEGRPLTLGHPDDDVTPETWRRLARGVVREVRRGEGGDADLLLADILVTDAEAIARVRAGLRELSCGYDAIYEPIAPGVARQRRLRGNHIALVSEGRCGPRCAIRDRKTKVRDSMTLRQGLLGAIFGSPVVRQAIDADPKARRALDAAIAEEARDADPEDRLQPATPQPATPQPATPQPATDEPPAPAALLAASMTTELAEIKLLLRSLLEKLDGREGRSGDEDPERAAITDTDPATVTDTDPATVTDTDPDTDPQPATDGQAATDPRKAGDAVRRSGADAAIVRDAAILAPGLAVALGDPATIVQRMALRAASRDGAIRRVVDAALDGARIDDARGGALNLAWASAVEVARARINGRTADALSGAGSAATRPRRAAGRDDASTPADLNALFAQHRASLKG